MNDLISRQAAVDALDKRFDSIPMEQTTEILQLRKDLRKLPSAQPETHEERTETHTCDLISRQAAMEEISKQQTYKMFEGEDTLYLDANDVGSVLASLPSAQPDSKETSSTHKALDTISRQDAIDAVQKLRDAEVRQYGKVPCKGYWELTAAMNAVRCVPSAQPEIVRCGSCKYAEIADARDNQDGYTCQFHRGSIWFSGSYCSWAERRTDEAR